MKLKQFRLYDNGNDTIGIMYYLNTLNSPKIEYVYTVEDEYRSMKVPGNTRIPVGTYPLVMRNSGGFYDRYCKHKNNQIQELTKKYGLPWIKNVPNFEYILIHCGNTSKDTAGCICVGLTCNNNSIHPGFISNSILAYIKLMTNCIGPAIDRDKDMNIEILDFDRSVGLL